MDKLTLVNLIAFIFFNPLIILAYIVAFSEDSPLHCLKLQPFYDVGGNSMRINLWLYLLFCPLAYAGFIALQLYVVSPLSAQPLSVFELLQVELSWSNVIAHLASVFTLAALLSRAGVEGNVAGFIFAPVILVGSALLFINHVSWLTERVLP